MSWLDRIRGRKTEAEAPAPISVQCPHVTLVPHWDNPEDMGHEDRATSFRCDACGSGFTPAEAASSAARRRSVSLAIAPPDLADGNVPVLRAARPGGSHRVHDHARLDYSMATGAGRAPGPSPWMVSRNGISRSIHASTKAISANGIADRKTQCSDWAKACSTPSWIAGGSERITAGLEVSAPGLMPWSASAGT